MIICKQCKGTGWVSGGSQMPGRYTCGICKGTGKVQRHRTQFWNWLWIKFSSWNHETKIIAGFMCLYLIYNFFEGTAGIPILFVLVFLIAPRIWNYIKVKKDE